MAIDAGNRCGNWPTTVPVVGVLDEKPHEAHAVVVGPLMRRKEQVARERRHRGDDRIAGTTSAPRCAIWIPSLM